MNDESNFGPVEITLAEGITWADNYRKDPKADEDVKKKVDGYLIPVESLNLVLKQGVDAVRAYKGINKKGAQTLILVGTKLNKETGVYEDIFNDGTTEECANAPVVYDGTRPVPPYGDPDSPLNP